MMKGMWFLPAVGLMLGGALVGCGEFTDSPGFRQSERLSPCDGFGGLVQPLRAEPPAYCEAGVLYFTHQADGDRLTLLDSRVLLNCCGEHHVRLELEEGVFVMRETDDPERLPGYPEGVRCRCLCVFDFEVTAEGIPAERIRLRLERLVSDDASRSGLAWEGELDLTAGAGFVVIDPNPEPDWCTGAAQP